MSKLLKPLVLIVLIAGIAALILQAAVLFPKRTLIKERTQKLEAGIARVVGTLKGSLDEETQKSITFNVNRLKIDDKANLPQIDGEMNKANSAATAVLDFFVGLFFLVLLLQYSVSLTVIGVTFSLINLAALLFLRKKITDMNQGIQQDQGKEYGTAMNGLFDPVIATSSVSSHSESVVPTCAPATTAIPCISVINPELTNPTTITVVADDDCSRHVTPIPTNTAANRLSVTAEIHRCSLSPASACNPSDIILIPRRKIPTPPSATPRMESTAVIV